MRSDPSERGGPETSPSSETDSDLRAEPDAARASASPRPRQIAFGLIACVAILIGFGVGTRIGLAESGPPGAAPVATQARAARASSEAQPGGEYALAAATPANGKALRKVVPIDALPVYRGDSSVRGVAGVEEEEDHFHGGDSHADSQDSYANSYGSYGSAYGESHGDGSSGLAARESATPGSALTIVTRGTIRKGESLGASLRRQGIAASTVHLIAREMRKVFDFRRSRPGDEYRLGQDPDGRVLDFRYSQSPEESYRLAWQGTRYVVKKETTELRPEIAKIAGFVDSSFYGAVVALGEQSALASEFARILAWDIDFSRNVHPGDEFQILYERLYRRDPDGRDVYVRPGRILAGRYAGRGGVHTVVYFEDEKGIGAYFRPDGSSVERAFLAAPLEFSRITSRFTRARRHPILKVTRPHLGIDYAAPKGTPIWAVADGVVEYRGRAGASGNLVRVRHANGITSHYAHLSRFATGISVGDRVKQREVIGYVGSTGLSTGPHVCFRVKQDGRYVDPMKIGGPAGAPVRDEHRAVFQSVRDRLLADLGPGPVSLVDEAL